MVLDVDASKAIYLVYLSSCEATEVFGDFGFSFKDYFLVFDLACPEVTEPISLIS